MVVDPEAAVDKGADDDPSPRPAVDEVEFFVSTSGSKEQECERRVLRTEEKDDGKLGDGEEAFGGEIRRALVS